MSIPIACALIVSAVMLPAAWAGENGAVKAAKEQLRRSQEQKRQIEAEKNQLSQENQALVGKLKAAEGEEGKRKAAEANLRGAHEKLSVANASLARLRADLESLKTQLAQKEQELAKNQQALAVEQAARSQGDKGLQVCAEKNEAIYRQGRELIRGFSRNGVCDAVTGEPLFGISSVARENALEEARDQLDAQRYKAGG